MEICENDDGITTKCMTGRAKKFLVGSSINYYPDYRSAILPNGSSIGVDVWSADCTGDFNDTPAIKTITCGSINLDLNGPKKGKYILDN